MEGDRTGGEGTGAANSYREIYRVIKELRSRYKHGLMYRSPIYYIVLLVLWCHSAGGGAN